MRKNRLIALGLWILSLIAISFYGGPVSYGFFFFMLAVPVISALYAILVFFRFRIYQKIETKVAVAENPVTFYYSLQNEDRFAFSGIRTDFFTDFSTLSGLDPDTEYELFPHSGIQKKTQLICKYRGAYEVGVKYVTVRDYLKLFSFTFRNRETITVTVIPQLVVLDSVSALDSLIAIGTDSPINPTEPDVLVREYIPGDDIRNIHWNLTAATGKPMVRNRIGENTPAISILMDSHRISRIPEEFLPLENKLLEVTIALAYHYLECGIRVNVYAWSAAPLCLALERMEDFPAFYDRMSFFSFHEDSTSDKLFRYAAGVPEIAKSSAVLFVLHEPDDAYRLLKTELESTSVPTATCLVSDKNPKTAGIIAIGYDDKLKEVLA